jgi:glutathione synthase/RimK-type ligase-like ATP-grasp enzyme
MTEYAIETTGLPLVAKPNADASGGNGVTLCRTAEEVEAALQLLTASNEPAAVSPFMEFDEFRTVVLDGKARITYEKHRAEGEWMHNLGKGARPEVIELDSELAQSIGAVAISALDAIHGRFASVDVALDHNTDELSILEINDGVAMVNLSQTPRHYDTVKTIYGDAVEASLRAT